MTRLWGITSLDTRHNCAARKCEETGSPSFTLSVLRGQGEQGRGTFREGTAQGTVSSTNEGTFSSNIS